MKKVAVDAFRDSATFTTVTNQAVRRAVRQAVARHHQAGHAVTVLRDGRLVRVGPDGIVTRMRQRASARVLKAATGGRGPRNAA